MCSSGEFFVAVRGFHGEEPATHFYIGEADLTQHPQLGYGSGRCKVKGVPPARLEGELLGAGVTALHPLQSQCSAHLAQPVQALAPDCPPG